MSQLLVLTDTQKRSTYEDKVVRAYSFCCFSLLDCTHCFWFCGEETSQQQDFIICMKSFPPS